MIEKLGFVFYIRQGRRFTETSAATTPTEMF